MTTLQPETTSRVELHGCNSVHSSLTPDLRAVEKFAATEPTYRVSYVGVALFIAAVLLTALVVTQPQTRAFYAGPLVMNLIAIWMRGGGYRP